MTGFATVPICPNATVHNRCGCWPGVGCLVGIACWHECCGAPAAIEARVREQASAEGYAVACAVLRGVAQRTGSNAALWAAEYLEADPDRQAPSGARAATISEPA